MVPDDCRHQCCATAKAWRERYPAQAAALAAEAAGAQSPVAERAAVLRPVVLQAEA